MPTYHFEKWLYEKVRFCVIRIKLKFVLLLVPYGLTGGDCMFTIRPSVRPCVGQSVRPQN
jgi:hypothetical protein